MLPHCRQKVLFYFEGSLTSFVLNSTLDIADIVTWRRKINIFMDFMLIVEVVSKSQNKTDRKRQKNYALSGLW